MSKLSDRIRGELRAELAPCPTCGHARTTIVALAGKLGVGASALGRFIGGATPSVPLLDAAHTYLEAHLDVGPEPARVLTAVGPE